MSGRGQAGAAYRIIDLADHYARAEPPLLSYREIAPACRSAAPTPLFMFGPSSAFLARQMFGQTGHKAVGCYEIADAAVGPTGIAMKGTAAFALDTTNHPRRHVEAMIDRMGDGIGRRRLPERHIGGPLVALFGPAHDTYGHVLVDYIPKLWVLQQGGYDLASLRFLVPERLAPVVRELLLACGIEAARLLPYRYWDEIIRTDLLVIPTIARSFNRLSPCFGAAAGSWTDRVKAFGRVQGSGWEVGTGAARSGTDRLGNIQRGEVGPKKVLLSRRDAPATRVLANREQIEAAAARHGFAVVRPEAMSLAEQIALFDGAEQVVGEYGSALHNTMFSRPGTVTCALRGTLADPGCIQSGVAAALGQRTGYVFGATTGQDRDQRFTIEPADFDAAMEVLSVMRH